MSKYTGFAAELTGALDAMQSLRQVPARILQMQRRALGTLQRRMGTEAKRDIGAEYNLLASRIAEGLNVRMTADGVSVIGKSRGINAIAFGATWSRVKGSGLVATLSRRKFTAIRYRGKLRGDAALGARFAIKRGKAPEVRAGSFIGTAINGVPLVFEEDVNRAKQKYAKGYNAGRTKYPLRSVYGPSVAQMLKHGRRPERLIDFAIRTLQSEQARLLGSTAR